MEKKFRHRNPYKFFYKLKNKVIRNDKVKIGILIFLVICLFTVIIIGNSYANKLNKKNVNLKVITVNKEEKEADKKIKEEKEKLEKEKEEKIRVEKANKLKDIKEKIIELDPYYNIEETFGDIDKDITHYESVYKELEEYRQLEESNTVFEENQQIDNNIIENNSPSNVQTPTVPQTVPPIVQPTEPVIPPTEPVVQPTEPVIPPTEPVVPPTQPPTEPGGGTTPEVPVDSNTESD